MSEFRLKSSTIRYVNTWGKTVETFYFITSGKHWHEVDTNDLSAVETFIDDINRVKQASPYGAAVHVYTAEEYQGFRLFQNPNGTAGFAIKPDGDLVSVYSSAGGVLSDLVAVATQLGACKLDCFDGRLVELYSALGFREVDRVQWDDQYQPEGWSKEQLGTPDVVFLEYAPE